MGKIISQILMYAAGTIAIVTVAGMMGFVPKDSPVGKLDARYLYKEGKKQLQGVNPPRNIGEAKDDAEDAAAGFKKEINR
jgi:hypothetical protein